MASPLKGRPRSDEVKQKIYRKPSRLQQMVAVLLDALGVQHGAQFKIGKYMADFFVPSHRLVIECDGRHWHSSEAAQQRDRERDGFMESQGYRVLRLDEQRILRGEAVGAIRNVLGVVSC